MGTGRGLPRFPPLPDECVRICRDPQSHEFPLHHYSSLGTGKDQKLKSTDNPYVLTNFCKNYSLFTYYSLLQKLGQAIQGLQLANKII